MRVVVVGGGISGLSCALELAERGVKVTVLEADERCGGQSRSIQDNDGTPLCYSWRIFTTRYENLLDTFRRIPCGDGKTVRDRLVPTGVYRTATDDEEYMHLFGTKLFEAPSSLTQAERDNIIGKMVTLLGMCEERLKALDNMTAYEFIAPKSDAASTYVDHIVGPFLGLEARGASVYCVAIMMQAIYANAQGLVPNAPYQEAIFDPWVAHLRRLGVVVRTDQRVLRVEDKVVHLASGESLQADGIALCVDQHALVHIASASPSLGLTTVAEFARLASQLYFSFELLIPGEVDLPWNVFTVKQTAWLPIVERWNRYYGTSREQWNVAVLDGLEYRGRTIAHTPPDEIVSSSLEQLRHSSMLANVKLIDGRSLWEVPLDVRVWPYWMMEGSRLVNTQNQYKISFNKGCFSLAPQMRTNVPSVIIGSVIARHHPIVSQEAACHNGRAAANALLGGGKVHVYHPRTYLPQVLPVHAIDRILFALKSPPISYNVFGFFLTNIILPLIVVIIIRYIHR